MGLFDAPEPVRVEIQGNELFCVICRHNGFWRRRFELDRASIFNSDWLEPVATCYECDKCGYLHWFMPKYQASARWPVPVRRPQDGRPVIIAAASPESFSR